MTAKTVAIIDTEPDSLLLEELGASLRRERLARNLSQADLGKEAGVSRDTVRRMEAGEPVSTLSLVRALRVLGIADRLAGIAPARGPGPLEQLEKGPTGRQRARSSTPRSKPASEWRWGDGEES